MEQEWKEMPYGRDEAKYMEDSRVSNAPAALSLTVTEREYELHRHYSPPQRRLAR